MALTLIVVAMVTLCVVEAGYDTRLGLYRQANVQYLECARRAPGELQIHTLTATVRGTDVILTGSVKAIRLGKQRHRRQTYTAAVQVKRILKGSDDLHKNMHGRHRRVNVDGLGNETVCGSFVIDGDTRIFFLNNDKQSKKGHYSLASRALRISRDTLQRVEAVTRSAQYHPASGAPERPCDRHFCAFGAKCHNVGDTAECRCIEPDECPEEDDPVCGSDDVTYDSE